MARAAKENAKSTGRALALVPLLVAVVFGALLLPRSAPPDAVPLPEVDRAALARDEEADRKLAAAARASGLPDDVRVLGSALRDYHLVESGEKGGMTTDSARHALDAAYDAARAAAGDEGLLRLRAVQLEEFLSDVHSFEQTGTEPAELREIAGPFLQRLTQEGWCRGHEVLPGDAVRRVMLEQMWNAVLGLDRPPFALGLNETRALYAFYLEHPHPADQARFYIDAARRAAKDEATCEALDEGERMATEAWRLDRIERLSALDPSYPADYARGVEQYRKGEYRAAVASFQTWLDAHPRGRWSLRAQDHLKAALEAARVDR